MYPGAFYLWRGNFFGARKIIILNKYLSNLLLKYVIEEIFSSKVHLIKKNAPTQFIWSTMLKKFITLHVFQSILKQIQLIFRKVLRNVDSSPWEYSPGIQDILLTFFVLHWIFSIHLKETSVLFLNSIVFQEIEVELDNPTS